MGRGGFLGLHLPQCDGDAPLGCGHTMFKLSGRGAKKPFCINPDCANFTPEDKRGYYKKKEEGADGEKKGGKN